MKPLHKIILAHLTPSTLPLAGILCLSVLSTIFQTLSPWPFKVLLDNVLGDELLDVSTTIGNLLSRFDTPLSLGMVVVAAYFLISLFSSFLGYLTSLFTSIMIRHITHRFSASAFANLEKFDLGYFNQQDQGDYAYRLNYEVTALGALIENGIMPILYSVLYLGFTIVVLLNISVPMTLLSLVTLPFLYGSLYVLNKKIVSHSQASEKANSLLFTFVDQALSQLKMIQAFVQEHQQYRLFSQTMHHALEKEYRVTKVNLLLTLIVGLVVAISYTIIIGLGISFVVAGSLSTGLLIVFIFYLDNLTTPMMDIVYALSSAKQSYVQLERLGEFFDPQYHVKNTGRLKTLKDYSVEFKKVSLYSHTQVPILKQFSLKIPSGQFTAIIGTSGSGKSSFTSLILRLINEPSEGQILIGRQDIKAYALDALRHHIALVPQETTLLNDTIYNNIIFGKTNATQAEVETAARLAVAHDFIKARPNGYQYQVGENGTFLSGGQRQRILLARAYLTQAPIVILDEILSAQDETTQKKMMVNLRQFARGRTVLMITHTYQPLIDQDYVIQIEKGKLVSQGLYSSLR